ncbi:hypothetical protein QQ054_09835 [Oscillatoria amoena NRMC-F 0135]|nr:hypothetical protein [Oscillatoria amoena NRMC-F 0135]
MQLNFPILKKHRLGYIKKIFATLDIANNRACLMLSPEEQSVFTGYNKAVIYPVPNKWGLAGATFVELSTVPPDLLKDALTVAYEGKIRNRKRLINKP